MDTWFDEIFWQHFKINQEETKLFYLLQKYVFTDRSRCFALVRPKLFGINRQAAGVNCNKVGWLDVSVKIRTGTLQPNNPRQIGCLKLDTRYSSRNIRICWRGPNCVTRAPLLYFIRSWVALSFKVCSSVRHRWHLTRSPLCAIYKGINALYWSSFQLLHTTS